MKLQTLAIVMVFLFSSACVQSQENIMTWTQEAMDLGIVSSGDYLYGVAIDTKNRPDAPPLVHLQFADGSTNSTSAYWLQSVSADAEVDLHAKVHAYELLGPWKQSELSKNFLDSIATSVEFAFREGAARKIAERDLNHFHVLVKCGIDHISVEEYSAILFHAQEYISYGPDARKKRNILFRDGEAVIFHPIEKSKASNPGYTVYSEQLELCHLDQGYLVNLEGLDEKRLERPTQNLINVDEMTLFVGFPKAD